MSESSQLPRVLVTSLPKISSQIQRINCEALCLYHDETNSTLYVRIPADEEIPFQKVLLKKVFSYKKYIEKDQFPLQCTLSDLKMDANGTLSLDGYSSISNVKPATFDIKTKLHKRSNNDRPGDMVKHNGVVSKISEKSSLQWLQCETCKSDQLVNSSQGWKCVNCDKITKPEHKITLVCKVGSYWVTLSHSAKKILPNNAFESFHPADVIGQIVPEIVGIIRENCLLDEI